MYRSLGILLAITLLLAGCTQPMQEDNGIEYRYTFEDSAESWTGEFSDYPADFTPEHMELVFDRRPLPAEVQQQGHGLYLAGRNLSDDLFMYLRRRITGLQPATRYRVDFTLHIASNAPTGCAGIGGAPGESVFLKVGASPVEPQPVVSDGQYRLNIDKGNQSSGGQHAVVIGNIANGAEECTGTPYRMITRTSGDQSFTISSNDNGAL